MPEPFKSFLDKKVVRQWADLLLRVQPDFPADAFLRRCLPQLEALELKQRAQLIADALWDGLDLPPAQAFPLLRKAIEPLTTLDSDGQGDGPGWLLFPLNPLLYDHGPKAFGPGLALARELTRRFTAEFGIRSFLDADPRRALDQLEKWTRHPDANVRRLVSEGSRPRLPWAPRLAPALRQPDLALPLLEALRDDPSAYVRRSVANHLNDIAKDYPETVVATAAAWLPHAPPSRVRLLKHACRSLVKQGHPRCLELFGYRPPRLHASLHLQPESLVLGETLVVTVSLQSTSARPQNLIADFRFHFIKANGRAAPKVFKGRVLQLPPGKSAAFTQRFRLKPVTTRRYYPGPTTVELLLNGQALAEQSFHLSLPP